MNHHHNIIERASLTDPLSSNNGGRGVDGRSDIDNKHSGNDRPGNFLSNFISHHQSAQDQMSSLSGGCDAIGYNDYKHGNPLRMGKYSGYCTILESASSGGDGDGGRVSMHDDWEFNAENDNVDENSDDYVDNDDDDGQFVSFWGQSSINDDCESSSSSSDSRDQKWPQHHDTNGDTTLNNFRSWFQREWGLNDRHMKQSSNEPANGGRLVDNNNNNVSSTNRTNDREDEALVRRRGFGRRQARETNSKSFLEQCDNNISSNNANNYDREEYVLYSAPSESIDGESAHDGHGEQSNSFGNIGFAMSNQTKQKADLLSTMNKSTANIFGNDRIRSGEGILSLPLVRPFLRGSRRGFSDQNDGLISNEREDENDDCNNLSFKEDRAVMMKSVSHGITGALNHDSVLLNNPPSLDNNSEVQANAPKSAPNWLDRIFLKRFMHIQHSNEKLLLLQLHDFIRKEDWSLATDLLESKPMLARRWHSVQRLYGGRFDGEALPIHSACALCPPASFIQTLARIHPEGLLEKEKSFGRVPLHIACRCFADSSVIKVLCEMEPRSVVERDNLKRVPLHYLIKNCNTFGRDVDDGDIDKDTVDESTNTSIDKANYRDQEDADGIVALKLLVETNIDCIKVADHRGWIPLHVACSSSAVKGMIRVIKMLINWWPESVNVSTERNSNVFACVDMGGKHHPTKDKVLALLKESMHEVETSGDNDVNEDVLSASLASDLVRKDTGSLSDDDVDLSSTVESEKQQANDAVDGTTSWEGNLIVDVILPK